MKLLGFAKTGFQVGVSNIYSQIEFSGMTISIDFPFKSTISCQVEKTISVSPTMNSRRELHSLL